MTNQTEIEKLGISALTLRAYGILINANNELLLSDEHILNNNYTKLPGGGLELGEGLHHALQREFMEELQMPITVKQHFYTTPVFLRSQFNSSVQVISVYYYVALAKGYTWQQIPTSNTPYNFNPVQNGSQAFRWKALHQISPNDVSFTIDKIVVELLKQQHGL